MASIASILSRPDGPSGVMDPGGQVVPITVRVRADALPEYTRYRDDGCDVHPNCLTCPLPRCRYDEPGGLRALVNAHRDREIVEMRLSGAGVGELAGRFGLSRRSVFRILSGPHTGRLAAYRRANGNGNGNGKMYSPGRHPPVGADSRARRDRCES